MKQIYTLLYNIVTHNEAKYLPPLLSQHKRAAKNLYKKVDNI